MPRPKKKNTNKNTDSDNEQNIEKRYFDIIPPHYEESGEDENIYEEQDNDNFFIPIRKETFTQEKSPEKPKIIAHQEIAATIIEEIKEYPKKEGESLDYSYLLASEKNEKINQLDNQEKWDEKTYNDEEDSGDINLEKPARAKKSFFNKNNKIFIATLVCICGIILTYILATFVFNKAKIIISPVKSAKTFEGLVIADTAVKNIDNDKNIIPGKLISLTKNIEKEFPATGKVMGGAKAHGKIIIYNAYSTSPQILVTSTRFESPDGLIFRTNSRVIVPGATIKNGELVPSTIEVEVTADEPGSKYNIAPSRFTIPGFKGTDKYQGFYGESTTAMTGGSDGESIVVSQADIKNAEKQLAEELFKALNNDLEKQITKDERVFKEATITKVGKIETEAQVGDSKEKFKVSMSGEISTITVSNNDLNELIKNDILATLEKDTIIGGDLVYSFSNFQLNLSNGTLQFYVIANTTLKKDIDENAIIQAVKGKPITEVQQILKQNLSIEKTKILLSPPWLNTIPSDIKKIQISLD